MKQVREGKKCEKQRKGKKKNHLKGKKTEFWEQTNRKHQVTFRI